LNVDSKFTEKILSVWDAEVFTRADPGIVSDSEAGSEDEQHPELLAFAQGIQESNSAEGEPTFWSEPSISNTLPVQTSADPPTRPASPVLEDSMASLSLVPITNTSAHSTDGRPCSVSPSGAVGLPPPGSLQSTSTASQPSQRRRLFRQPTPAEPIDGTGISDGSVPHRVLPVSCEVSSCVALADICFEQQSTSQDVVNPAPAAAGHTPPAQALQARRTRRGAATVSQEVVHTGSNAAEGSSAAAEEVAPNVQAGAVVKPRPRRRGVQKS
jgi:hypothetical protein